MHLSLLLLSCFWTQHPIEDEELVLQNPNTSENVRAEILFDAQGKSAFGMLNIPDQKRSIQRIRTGVLRNNDAQSTLEITGDCTKAIEQETERICLPSPLDISIFAPRLADSHAARSIFQIRGFKRVWIHDLRITTLPAKKWTVLLAPCKKEDCEQVYKERIHSLISKKEQSIEALVLTKQGLHSKSHFDCDGDGEFETPSKDALLTSYLDRCAHPYTGMWNYWKRTLDSTAQLRRMGSFFYLYDNDNILIENNELTGITGKGMIRAVNNGTITIRNNTLSGIHSQRLKALGYDIEPSTILMGTGISIVEGAHSSILFDRNTSTNATHRKNCIGRNKAHGMCTVHEDCSTHARCVQGQCKSNSCDTQAIDIHHNQIFGCTPYSWNKKVNDDGIQLTSVPANVHHNSIQNFIGCDTLLDVGHRGGCDFKQGEHPETIHIYDNHFENGKIKTTGASAGEHTVNYSNNSFTDVRVSDYHQYWTSRYTHNTWRISSFAEQDYLWGERAAIGAQPWQHPFYGHIEFSHNHIQSQKEKLIILFSKRFDPQKISMHNNVFEGKSFIWLKSQGENRELQPKLKTSEQVFQENWDIQKGWAMQAPKTVFRWNDFVHIAPQNRWIEPPSPPITP